MALVHVSGYLSQPLIVLLLLTCCRSCGCGETTPAFLIALVFASAGPPLLYAVAQAALYRDWKRRFLYLPALLAVGAGMTWSTTRAVWQGLTTWGGVFKRTPKFRLEGRGREVERERVPAGGRLDGVGRNRALRVCCGHGWRRDPARPVRRAPVPGAVRGRLRGRRGAAASGRAGRQVGDRQAAGHYPRQPRDFVGASRFRGFKRFIAGHPGILQRSAVMLRSSSSPVVIVALFLIAPAALAQTPTPRPARACAPATPCADGTSASTQA